MEVTGTAQAPQWLLSAWRRSVVAIGATAGHDEIERTGVRLIERWSSHERVHHNLKRLVAVLARVDELSPQTHDPDLVRIAAWYHGAVFTSDAQNAYAHRGGADAQGSAALARTELSALGVPGPTIDRLEALVRSLERHVAPPGDIDAQALCDADLGGLAVEPQRYEAYRREVRAEYAHIPDRDYAEARLAIIDRLLQRHALFTSPLGRAWEGPARDNLHAEQVRLQHELDALSDAPVEQPPPAGDPVRSTIDAHRPPQPAEPEPTASGPAAPEPSALTAADRVDLARRAAQERANQRRAAAAADRERRRREKQERAEQRAREREQARRTDSDDDGSSMSRPPTL